MDLGCSLKLFAASTMTPQHYLGSQPYPYFPKIYHTAEPSFMGLYPSTTAHGIIFSISRESRILAYSPKLLLIWVAIISILLVTGWIKVTIQIVRIQHRFCWSCQLTSFAIPTLQIVVVAPGTY